MIISGSAQITSRNLYSSLEIIDKSTQNIQFQTYMDDLQIKSDLVEHLQGVPLDSVSIPPNVLEKMKNDKAAYTYYMNAIDEYVRGYKMYNCPGVLKMSFFVTSEGEYCIRGENLILQQQIEESKNGERSDSADEQVGTYSQRFYQPVPSNIEFQLCSNNIIAPLYLMKRFKLEFHDSSHSSE